jgi:hypothetical protein
MEQASRLCRSGAFPTCERFQSAHPDWHPAGGESTVAGKATPLVSRDLLISIAWVIGIPTAITFLIMLAIWITENVWMPTESILLRLIG